MTKIKIFVMMITLSSFAFARSDNEAESLSATCSAPKIFTQIPQNSSSADLATTLIDRPETQLIQKTFEKLSEINPNFLNEKRETFQEYIKEGSFFQKNPNLQSAALNYMDAFYYATKTMKYQVDAGAKLFIPCVLLGIHIATGDVPLAITTGVSLANNLVHLVPGAIENWKNTGRMAISAIKTVSSLTKSAFGLFKNNSSSR